MASELTPCVALRSWLMARAKLTAPIGNRAMMATMPTVRMAVAMSTSIRVTPGRRVVTRMAVLPAGPVRGRRWPSQARVGILADLAVRVATGRVVDDVRRDLPGPRVHAD